MASISQESLLLIPSERFPLTRQRAAEYLLSEERPGRSGERSSRQTANYKANQKETYKIGLENKGVCLERVDSLPGYSRGNRISRPKLARVGNSREIDNSGESEFVRVAWGSTDRGACLQPGTTSGSLCWGDFDYRAWR